MPVKKESPKQVKLSKRTNNQLDELSELRKNQEHQVKSKQDIVSDLVNKLYKREIK